MHVVLACATRRGLRFLEHLAHLAPDARLTVFSFPEEPHEPPFVEAIGEACRRHGADFHVTSKLADEAALDDDPFDLLFAVSWRYLIPPRVYERARIGAFVFHDSLLPRYRGFSPTVWAMVNGEERTGVTLFHMAKEVDSGAIVDQREVPFGPDETIAEVLERTTDTYLELLERNLPDLLAGRVAAHPQDESRATYCCKRLPEDNEIDWHGPTADVHNLVRAVTRPYPGAFTHLDGRRLTVWATRRLEPAPVYRGRVPGRVVEVRPGEGSVVLTGDGALLVTRVQPDGAEEASADRVLNRLSQTLGRRR